jgi:transposase-like protein
MPELFRELCTLQSVVDSYVLVTGLIAPQYQTEETARQYLENLLWPEGAVCPHCGVIGEATQLGNVFEGKLRGKVVQFKAHAREGAYQCNGCREQFSVTIGTIFEDSKIPLHKWLLAIHLMCSSSKGVSALQLQRELELGSYRSAWFLCHRVRWAMTQSPMAEALKMMSGVVEVDETYVGGNEKGRPGKPSWESKKTPVLAILERGGTFGHSRSAGYAEEHQADCEAAYRPALTPSY